MPLLTSVNYLIKFAQSRDVFISDFTTTMKMCQNELFMNYVDKDPFGKDQFQHFLDIVEDYSHTISHEWVPDMNTQDEFLSFRIADHTYLTHWLQNGQKVPMS